MAARIKDPRGLTFTFALIAETACVGAAAILAAAAAIQPGAAGGYLAIALLGIAMGIRNATVRKIALPDLTTTVLTMTLTALASESHLGGGSGNGSARRLAASGTLLAGALAGALLTKASLAAALGLAAGVVAGGSALQARHALRHAAAES